MAENTKIAVEPVNIDFGQGPVRVQSMVAHWKLTKEEIAILANGGVVVMRLLGDVWPPSKVYVDLPNVAGNG